MLSLIHDALIFQAFLLPREFLHSLLIVSPVRGLVSVPETMSASRWPFRFFLLTAQTEAAPAENVGMSKSSLDVDGVVGLVGVVMDVW